MEFFTSLYHVIVGLLFIGILSVGFLTAMGLMSMVFRHLGKGKKQTVCKKGLFQVHQTTVYDRHASIKRRLYDEQVACARKSRGGAAVGAAGAAVTQPALPPAPPEQKPVAVLRFDGDVMASDRLQMARLIDELLINKDRFARAIVVVSSPGGGVAQYGQLYSEMERIREAGIDLTVCVDTYAASGGYLMSLPANRIVAAPFAMVGSIGVVSELVNAHGFLTRLGFQPLVMTAGKYKRTVTTTGEVTPEAVEHYKTQLEAIHKQFIAAVTKYRKVDADKACTGDHWTAQESVDLGLNLVDELATSQAYLLKTNEGSDLVFLHEKKNPFERGIFRFLTRIIDHVIERIAQRMNGGINA